LLEQQLSAILPPERVKTRPIDRYAFASDASHFYLVPQAVVQPADTEEIKKLFVFSQRHKIPMVFRAGGTSLSGQSITDGILVDLSRHWRRVTPENGGAQVRLEPAVIGGNANIALKKYGRKIGPDPASINSAMIGGMLSNNSSGMCCGVAQNAYHTLAAMRFVLPNGLEFNTENPDDYRRFENEAGGIARGVTALRQRILENPELTARIRSKYRQKNTTGYGLNAFLDFEHPLDLFARLLIGAEGTLGFIAEAVLETVPDYPCKKTGMLYFESPETACDAIFDLKSTGAEALEFMDRASLRSVEDLKGMSEVLKNLPPRAAAILCEYQAATPEALAEKYAGALPVLERLQLIQSLRFTEDAHEQALYWKIRKGMYPSVAGVRASGTAAMLEDLTFPVEKLGAAIADVQKLFEKHGYTNGIIFGHAKDGNLHFCIAQSFASAEETARFGAFNDDLFELVLKKYDGALKAEHGTGRAVAPYVEAEWGPEAYAVMRELKHLVDPHGLLNPDVIITADPNCHLRDLKTMPVVETEVDKCVECGFCERRCPSRDFTMTPRQRIGIRRALKRLEATGDRQTHRAILQDYRHDGMDTCAVDGMCATDCPVDINTGELIKRLRRENHSPRANKIALRLARNFDVLEKTVRFMLRAGFVFNDVLGRNFMRNFTGSIRKIMPGFPLWSNQTGRPPSKKEWGAERGERAAPNPPIAAVYFSSCISRMMGGDIFEVFKRVCTKAGVRLLVPTDSSGACCGQIFASKGFWEAYRHSADAAVEKMWRWSEEGLHPVVMDVTSCSQYLQNCRAYLGPENQKRFDRLRILDSIEFAAEVLAPRLNITRKKEKIVFHPVCSVYKMGLMGKIQEVGKACAQRADIPAFAGCCGMAGDRGFYFPELTRAATRLEAEEVKQQSYEGYYSSAQTCSMNFSESVGREYKSMLHLLDEVS
jgi:D-lactate dehydrogenase